MIAFNLSKAGQRALIMVLASLVISACQITQQVPANGYIVSSSGMYDCAEGETCIIDVVNGAGFSDTFTAVANPGYRFVAWQQADKYLCGGSSAACALVDVPGSLTDQDLELFLAPIFEEDPDYEADPQAFFEQNIAGPVVGNICVACHVEGGVASITPMLFQPGSVEDTAAANFASMVAYLQADSGNGERMLDKVRGVAHGGGPQLSGDSTEFQNLATFIGMVSECGDACDVSSGGEFFEGLALASPERTLRRASILLAGRLPSEAEYEQAESGDEGLREALRGLMSGDTFHDFLIRGANDRLFTDGFFNGLFLTVADSNWDFYPLLASKQYDMLSAGQEEAWWEWSSDMYFGMTRSPLELIAYVVENDLPYSEILTADYMMQNPQLAEIFRADIDFDSDSPFEFKPGANRGQIFQTPENITEYFEGFGVLIHAHGDFIDYPVAGILNSPAFLSRYPTTDTNRNRARARWTFYHFLDFDIEKSAGRTTDPEALADTNNPTMNNANCTVCHQIMDPVAGAFQNYGNESYYRQSWEGMDSLSDAYKWPSDGETLYEWGDTWYRDMRTPGFEGTDAPSADNSLQWLAEQITEDDRFYSASVKFWWPSVMGVDALLAPEESSDADFDQKLRAFEQQSADIGDIASEFAEHRNLKDMLVDVLMSPWFRAQSSAEALSEERQTELADLGDGVLLTPKALENKTEALTGIAWGKYEADWDYDGVYSNLGDRFRIYYGGIDSNGITTRARELTSLMSNVATGQAVDLACPTVILDFARGDEDRLMFDGISKLDTPVSDASQPFEVSSNNTNTANTFELTVDMDSTARLISVSFDNDWYDETIGDRNIIFKTLRIYNASGDLVSDINWGTALEQEGGFATSGGQWEDYWYMWGAGSVGLSFTPPGSGSYRIVVEAYADLAGPDLPQGNIIVELAEAGASSAGSSLLRGKLVQMHERLLGESLSPDSEEIGHSYDLLVELWESRRATGNQWAHNWPFESCNIPVENYWDVDRSAEFSDPAYMLGTWADMMVYFLTDYKFLHE